MGAAAGASGVVWAEQKVRRRLEELGPDHLAVLAGNSALRVGRSVLDAVADGRLTMREREDELRALRDRRLREGRPATPTASPPPGGATRRSGPTGR